jgi:hypothetical protein
MTSTIGDFIVDISQADREHSTIGCEVVHCCDAVVTHVTLYHIFQVLLMYMSSDLEKHPKSDGRKCP